MGLIFGSTKQTGVKMVGSIGCVLSRYRAQNASASRLCSKCIRRSRNGVERLRQVTSARMSSPVAMKHAFQAAMWNAESGHLVSPLLLETELSNFPLLLHPKAELQKTSTNERLLLIFLAKSCCSWQCLARRLQSSLPMARQALLGVRVFTFQWLVVLVECRFSKSRGVQLVILLRVT